MGRASRTRLVDVATHLNVAPSTVSRALAGSSAVSEATRERVQNAAEELGYTVNLAASGLKRGQMLNIGLVAVMNHWYAGAVTSGADRVAADRGYDFVVVNSAGRDDEELLIERARRLGARVDGALIIDVSTDDGLLDRLIEALHVPVVTLGCQAENVSAVMVDNPAIGAMSADHLTGLGHRQAAILTLDPPSPSALNNGLIRARAFAAAFGGPEATTLTSLPRDDRDVRQHQILASVGDVSAVFCTSDALAIETVSLLRRAGHNVPGQISVVGVDDHPLSQPIGLTTVAQAPEAMGEIATELLLEHMLSDQPPSVVVTDVELVERQTTAVAPADIT